jgi:serine/threonine protein phosphatase PrpC
MVPDREVAAVLSVEPVGRIPDALIRLALAHGGKDNVTVIAVQVEDEVTVVPGKSALAEPTGDLEPIA